jgi:hypothetical protein
MAAPAVRVGQVNVQRVRLLKPDSIDECDGSVSDSGVVSARMARDKRKGAGASGHRDLAHNALSRSGYS